MSDQSVLPESERDKTLPPRFRSSAFRRYEAVLKQAVDNHPNEIEVDPTKFGLSLCTVEQRLRDAKRSYLDHHWNSKIDWDKFNTIYHQLIVSIRRGKIFIGQPPQAEYGDSPTGTVTADRHNKTHKTPLDCTIHSNDTRGLCTEINAISLLCWLAEQRALARPVKLTLLDSTADNLFNSFDINLEKQPDGSYILT